MIMKIERIDKMSLKDRLKKMREIAEKPIDNKADNKIIVKMPDGSFEEYPTNFYITDGIHCVCNKDCNDYHTHFDCPHLHKDRMIIGLIRKEADSKGMEYCFNCADWDKLQDDEDVI